MNIASPLLALGASAILALVILGGGKKTDKAFREKWESKNGGQMPPLSRLPRDGKVVPFKLIKDNPVIPIMLDGDDHLTCWIVDSGYGFTAVSKKLSKRLELPKTGELAVQTLQTDSLNSTDLPSGFIFDYRTNEPVVETPKHAAVVRDLPGTLDQTWGNGTACLKQGGILGITFLRHFVTRLDYKNKTLTFYDPERFTYKPTNLNDPGTRFDGWLKNERYFIIPMNIDGVTANMALDTGAFATIMTKGFLKKYKDETGHNFDANGTNGSVEASFSEHPINLKRKIVPRAQIADHLFRNFEVLFPDCSDAKTVCPGLLATKRFDGLLGYSVLKNFVIYMVYEPTPYVILEPSI